MKTLGEALAAWQEASGRPGVLGRAGWSNVVSFRSAAATYFQLILDHIDLSARENEYGLIEPHVRAAMVKAQPFLLASYLAHGKKALVLGAKLDAELMQEAASSLPNTSGDKDLVKKLDKLGLTGQEAVDYVINHGALMMKGIDAYTLKVIRSLIANGIEKQRGVDGTVSDIRKEFKDMKVVRARSIATTEMNDAMSEASLNKIKTVGLDGKRWVRSPGACPLCTANAAQGIIPVDQPFLSGHQRTPGHPGKCRCATVGARLANQGSFDATRNVGKY